MEENTTIMNDWCPSCRESCRDHATICTVCGDSLQSRPSLPTPNNEPSFRLITVSDLRPSDFPLNVTDMEASNHEIAALLGGLRERVSGIRQQVAEIRQRIAASTTADDDFALPPEIMDPQQGASSRSRPTSQDALDAIPRIIIKQNMSMVLEATLRVGNTTYAAVCGDFGPLPPIDLEDKLLAIAEPRTGKGGVLSDSTKLAISDGAILFMERGDGVSFVRKAMLAQEAGACAVVIGNNVSAVWPYTMKDSIGEERKLGLKIPVVMLKMSDGQSLVNSCHKCSQSCSLSIKQVVKECIICVENFHAGTTVVQLPGCSHVFHETCAMAWLKHHNSCPYCRRELPTDDKDYEAQRRLMQRDNAAASAPAFYG